MVFGAIVATAAATFLASPAAGFLLGGLILVVDCWVRILARGRR